MGSSYTNVHVRSGDQNAVKKALTQINALPAYVSKPKNGWVSAFPSEVEDQSESSMKRVCTELSGALKTGVFGITVHDSDIFLYTLAENGQVVDTYNSWPGYFDGNSDTPDGGNVEKLMPYCIAGTTPEKLASILQSGGKGLDSTTSSTDLGAIKRQLVKASPWWAKPVVWGAASVFQATQKGKSASAKSLIPSMPTEMLNMIWRGDNLASALAETMGISHDCMSSTYEHIKDDDAAVERRSLAHVAV